MWQRAARGSWTLKDKGRELQGGGEQKMSDSAEEYREVAEEASWQIGDSVVAYTYPLTEGLIIDRKLSEEGRLDLTLIIAPYKKKGKWSKTKVSLRDAARLSKKPPARFLFPIKGIEKLREEAKRAKADPIWVAAVKAILDKEFQQRDLSSDDSEDDQKEDGDESEDSEKPTKFRNMEQDAVTQKVIELEKRLGEVLQLGALKRGGKKKKKDKEDEDSDFEDWKKWKRDRKRKRKQKAKKKKAKSSSSSSSSSSSTSSSSEEESRVGEVGEKGTSGIFSCPFHRSDMRGFKDVKCQVQGQAATRKHVRLALHNLYAEYYTLASFADKFISKAYASPFRPFTMDVAWFQAYAEHIDTLLLNSLEGPWTLWNEPVLDHMVMGFLELLIRVSPHKDYPVCLDDSVRKWMKKKRIGTNTKFGPVSYAMQHAKFTDGGVVLHQTGGQRIQQKERFQPGQRQGNTSNSRTGFPPSSGGDKRPPPPS